eukprot:g33877.t1
MNAIYKFADDTTSVGRISNNDESKFRREIEGLVAWCNENNLSLNVNKTKELITDFRKKGRETPLSISMELRSRVKFLRVRITDDLSWTSHVNVTVKKAQQRLFFLKQLRKLGIFLRSLTNFYRCIIESILSGCITAWYDNCSAQDNKKLQNMVRTAQTIMEANLPSMDYNLYGSLPQKGCQHHQRPIAP